MVIGTYLQSMNSIYFIHKKQWLEVLRITDIGVLRKSSTASRGDSISPVAVSTNTLRTRQTMFASLGLFNHLEIRMSTA